MTIESPLKIETGPGRGAWAAPVRTFFSRLFKQDILGTVCAGLLAAIVVCALLAPWIAPYDFDAIDLTSLMQGPSWSHHLGTDELGRDILSRIIYGARTSVIVCITAALLSLALSVTLGVLSGYFGGRLDALVQRFVDTWQSFPDLIVLIAGVAVLGPGIVQIIALLGILYGVAGSRIVRGAVLSAREQLYVQAGHSFGAGNWHIILRHILPTIAAPLIVLYTTRLGGVILAESKSQLPWSWCATARTRVGPYAERCPPLHVRERLDGRGPWPRDNSDRFLREHLRRLSPRSSRSTRNSAQLSEKP